MSTAITCELAVHWYCWWIQQRNFHPTADKTPIWLSSYFSFSPSSYNNTPWLGRKPPLRLDVLAETLDLNKRNNISHTC